MDDFNRKITGVGNWTQSMGDFEREMIGIKNRTQRMDDFRRKIMEIGNRKLSKDDFERMIMGTGNWAQSMDEQFSSPVKKKLKKTSKPESESGTKEVLSQASQEKRKVSIQSMTEKQEPTAVDFVVPISSLVNKKLKKASKPEGVPYTKEVVSGASPEKEKVSIPKSMENLKRKMMEIEEEEQEHMAVDNCCVVSISSPSPWETVLKKTLEPESEPYIKEVVSGVSSREEGEISTVRIDYFIHLTLTSLISMYCDPITSKLFLSFIFHIE